MSKLPEIVQWPKGRLDFSKGPLIMGILNVTPDSFSDGGDFLDAERAVSHGIEMVRQGAAILDIGAESTRPGSKPVPPEEQIRRAIPVIERLAGRLDVPISIDTKDAEVARAATEAGAAMINDITALTDKRMLEVALGQEVAVVLMHMRGSPETMQYRPEYEDVVTEVAEFLMQRAKEAETAGIAKERIFIDPGIGFGKTLEHTLLLIKNLDVLAKLGYRVLAGPSRKSFIGAITGKAEPKDRLFGTAGAVALAAANGASILRVHDTAEMADVAKVARAICSAGEGL